jgi:long-chain fatty acid transport protein
MTLFSSNEAILGISNVAPKAEFHNGSAPRAFSSLPNWPAVSGSSSYPNSAARAVLPNLYVMWNLSPKTKLGLSINAPFGMKTEYGMDYIGRYHAMKSDSKVIDIAPHVAYRINEQWSVGLALVARQAKADLTNAMDFASILALSAGNPAFRTAYDQDGMAQMKGDAWGYGYRVGVVFQPMKTLRLGLAHHSAMNLTLKGDATFQFSPLTPAPFVAGLQAAGFRTGSCEAELNLPSMTSLGVNVDLSPTFSLKAEISQTGWSTFDELRAKFSTGLPDSVTEEKWKNTMFYSLGFSWKLSDNWTLRAGVAQDQGAVEDAYRTPRIPDADRLWYSAGVRYTFNKSLSVDFAYTTISVKDGPVQLKAIPAGTTASTSPNTFKADLNGTFQNDIDILAIQARFIF